LTLTEFILGKNPYADKGKCVTVLAATFQMVSEKEGLFKITETEIVHIRFPKTFRGYMVRGLAKVRGMYTYLNKMGGFNTVPDLILLDEISEEEFWLLGGY